MVKLNFVKILLKYKNKKSLNSHIKCNTLYASLVNYRNMQKNTFSFNFVRNFSVQLNK